MVKFHSIRIYASKDEADIPNGNARSPSPVMQNHFLRRRFSLKSFRKKYRDKVPSILCIFFSLFLSVYFSRLFLHSCCVRLRAFYSLSTVVGYLRKCIICLSSSCICSLHFVSTTITRNFFSRCDLVDDRLTILLRFFFSFFFFVVSLRVFYTRNTINIAINVVIISNPLVLFHVLLTYFPLGNTERYVVSVHRTYVNNLFSFMFFFLIFCIILMSFSVSGSNVDRFSFLALCKKCNCFVDVCPIFFFCIICVYVYVVLRVLIECPNILCFDETLNPD